MKDVVTRFAQRAYPMDWLVVGYCALMVVWILLMGRPFGDYDKSLVFYAVMGSVAAVIAYHIDEHEGRGYAVVRLLYPAVMFSFFYRATGGLMHLVFPEYFDWQLVTFEKMILGVHPTLFIDTKLLTTFWTELLSFCYGSYYLMLPSTALFLFFRGDWDVLKRITAAAAITFFASYILFSLYPVEGPRWYFAEQYQHAVDGPVFRKVVEYVIARGAVHGGAMPSSHTGVALIIMVYCLQHYRKIGLVLLPIVVGLAAGTVWGRFHYLSDVVVGALIAWLSIFLVNHYHDRWTANRVMSVQLTTKEGQHVS
ncbi:MAG: phosphatase PAP2 family protein [candidate division Zixibacteria bacterium]|nr:phosphatase PAP2 family protein [candidate division Zixibacteria bacterium]